MPMKSVLEYSCIDHIFLFCFFLYKRLNSGNTQNAHSGQPTVLQKDDQIFLASHPTHHSIRNRSWPRAGIHLELCFSRQCLAFQTMCTRTRAGWQLRYQPFIYQTTGKCDYSNWLEVFKPVSNRQCHSYFLLSRCKKCGIFHRF